MDVRQEVLNVALAQNLSQLSMISVPEARLRRPEGWRMPDVLIEVAGLKAIIEGEIEHPGAERKALETARKRIEEGVGDIVVAVVYPKELAEVDDFQSIVSKMSKTPLKYQILTFLNLNSSWAQGEVAVLANTLRRTAQELSEDTVINEAVEIMWGGVDKFLQNFKEEAILIRIAEVLGISPPEKKGDLPKFFETTAQVGSLVLLNALIFHETLSAKRVEIRPLGEFSVSPELMKEKLAEVWRWILAEVDYYPIFHLAEGILRQLPAIPKTAEVLLDLVERAQAITSRRYALRHDLVGRIYHRLLHHAKYLGTYYTSIPAAAILLGLALRPEFWPQINWVDVDSIAGFLNVVDLACGTGTLLMAAADTIVDNHIKACYEAGVEPKVKELQKALMEKVIWGFDVLPSAIHLTASTLALRAPDVEVRGMNLFSLPLGVINGEPKLGSVDFLARTSVLTPDLFGAQAPAQRVGPTREEKVSVNLPPLRLCVMNPPFTRNVGGNLLFGWLSPPLRKKLNKALRDAVRRSQIPASVQAGLGAVFVAIAHKYLETGGKVALVLPKALLSGVAWGKTRELLSRFYKVDFIVQSFDPQRWNFSENTDLSEVLLIATRGATDQGDVIFVNLWKNPDNIYDAVRLLRNLENSILPIEEGGTYIQNGREVMGVAFRVRWAELKETLQSWLLHAPFADPTLSRVAKEFVVRGTLNLKGLSPLGRPVHIPMKPLGELVELGPDVKQVETTFKITTSSTNYLAFWDHEASEVVRSSQPYNLHLAPKRGIRSEQVERVWGKAGKALIAERLWLNTQRLAAVYVGTPVLSNVWWPLRGDEKVLKALVLWLNSTLGLLSLVASRVETRGAWTKFKKQNLQVLPVPNFPTLPSSKMRRILEAFEELKEEPLLPFPEMDADPTRAKIDEVFQEVFGLPDLAPLRERLAREPVVSLRPLS